ncbi:hypothetical protein HBA55_15200 [Pseudomaricurvus alkylphenolicus]|jgi:nucleoside-specific outer membrane channel protein Tsx|uniref:outer membrane protein OmpK n=1 Tax=Pseudomaricurvus alkylphenolicus TaxID=1306991 RepID=UPI001421726D|nr:outer membrane protein OmpK [Pseudomaricurvus alkylphenolicus]NIB40948.1 hypothetical protein [Pseudomaricurvus alkylphenolicus]
MIKTKTTLTALTLMTCASALQAADWSSTEVHFQHGNLQKAFQGGGSESETGGTNILTLQHASGWKYGDNFFFIDHLNYGRTDAEKASGSGTDDELYGEWYSNFSLGKITGKDLSFGPVKDIGLIAGFNFAQEVDTLYYLPGVRFALNLPGFAFANLDVTSYIQDGEDKFGVDAESNTYMIDFNWAYPFKIGNTSWSLEGHVEYIAGSDITINGADFGAERESWILAQPQLRLDLGEVLFDNKGKLFVGLEYQYWNNKLGDANTDESEVQALVVWNL